MTYGANSGVRQYQQVGAQSANYADPHQLVKMLMDGALDRLAQAKGAMQTGDVAAKGVLLSKAIQIVGGLESSLDARQGGDIAAHLASLYDYMQRRLLHVNLRDDMEALDEVATLMRELRSAWIEMPTQARATPPASQQTRTG